MKIEVAEAARLLEAEGLLERAREDHSTRIIDHVREQVGHELPEDLADFYRERIARVGEFHAIAPIWNDHMGWRPMAVETTALRHAQAIPIFFDGSGSLFGLDLTQGETAPAVYFFDHEEGFHGPRWAAGSSLGAFLLLVGARDRAYREAWPPRWELSIDANIEKCRRAPAIWNLG